jgi:hypothetical protein
VRGTGSTLSKAVCAALFVAIPGFLSYPAPLNVDRREKSLPSANSVHVEIWPGPATTEVSQRPRWLIIDAPAANLRSQDDYVLTKDLQRQLRRLGCYSGEINGMWTSSTLRATQTFMNRINAVLPLEQPDRILLALLQSHPDKTCSKPCLPGEIPSRRPPLRAQRRRPRSRPRPDAAQAQSRSWLESNRDRIRRTTSRSSRRQAVGSPGDNRDRDRRQRQAGAAALDGRDGNLSASSLPRSTSPYVA